MSDAAPVSAVQAAPAGSAGAAPVKRAPMAGQKAADAQPAAKTPSPPISLPRTPWQESRQIQEVIESLTGANTEISVQMDADNNSVVLTVLDATTGEVIRRIPPEAITALISQLQKTNIPLLDTMA
jgi:flagellar protein FlaG